MFVKEIEAAELKARLDAGEDIALIDIRSDAEVAQGILPDSEHLAMHLIPLHMHDLPKDKTWCSTVAVVHAPTMPATSSVSRALVT